MAPKKKKKDLDNWEDEMDAIAAEDAANQAPPDEPASVADDEPSDTKKSKVRELECLCPRPLAARARRPRA